MPAAPSRATMRRHLGGQLRRLLGRHALGHRRRRHLEAGELLAQERDGRRVGPLVNAVEARQAVGRPGSRDPLVGQDHQLLDQAVRLRLLLRRPPVTWPSESNSKVGSGLPISTASAAGERTARPRGRPRARRPTAAPARARPAGRPSSTSPCTVSRLSLRTRERWKADPPRRCRPAPARHYLRALSSPRAASTRARRAPPAAGRPRPGVDAVPSARLASARRPGGRRGRRPRCGPSRTPFSSRRAEIASSKSGALLGIDREGGHAGGRRAHRRPTGRPRRPPPRL